MNEPDAEQIYFKEEAWNAIRLAYKAKQQGRRAKAQELLQEARYYSAKIKPKFIDRELEQNIDMANRTFF